MAEEEKKNVRARAGKQLTMVAVGKKWTVVTKTSAAKKTADGSEKRVEAGFELLTDALLEELRINGPEIVKKLVEKAMAGDTQSTKLLVAMVMEKLAADQKARLMKKALSKEKAEKKSAKQGTKRSSVAMNIEAAPEWGAERKKEDAKAAGGSENKSNAGQ